MKFLYKKFLFLLYNFQKKGKINKKIICQNIQKVYINFVKIREIYFWEIIKKACKGLEISV